MEPPVSVPMAATAEPSCTLAAAPLERTAGERHGVARLHAVSELRILACDSVSQSMKVRFAHDNGSGSAQLFDEPGVARGRAVEIAVEISAARGGGAGEIKAILYRDGQAPERGAAICERDRPHLQFRRAA